MTEKCQLKCCYNKQPYVASGVRWKGRTYHKRCYKKLREYMRLQEWFKQRFDEIENGL